MGSTINPAVEAAISLRNSIESLVDDPIRGSVGNFVAADPNSIPSWLRPYQAAYRRACDIYAATGAVGDLVGGIGVIYNPACGEYLGADLPQFTEGAGPGFTGGQCVGVEYLVTFNAVVFSGPLAGQTVQQQSQHPGPIGGFSGPQPSAGNPNVPAMILSHGLDQFGRTSTEFSGFTAANITNVQRIDGQPDNCGDPPSDPDTYPPTRPGPPPAPTFDYTDDDDGRPIQITIGDPTINADGTISVPITVGDVKLDFSGGNPGGTPRATNDPEADFDNGSDPIRPGDDGQPDDGVDYDGPVSCALVVVTTEPANASKEVGGPENCFIQGFNSDAGWYRFVKELGTTEQHRITSRTTISCYCCENKVADGFQVKFSYGYDGYVIIYPPKEQG